MLAFDSTFRPAMTWLVAASLTLAVPAALSADEQKAEAGAEIRPTAASADLKLEKAQVTYHPELELVVFELQVAGIAGATVPHPVGGMDGAPVLGYVFPTTLKPEQVGFKGVEGIVALAATSHPDFDDTPLWDENGNGDPSDSLEGKIFHTHWVVLGPDDRVAGGLAVKPADDLAASLPTTAPGMPIYLDSPGFSVVLQGKTLRIPVPAWRIRDLESFNYDAVTAYMQVNTSDPSRPTLGVYQVYSVLSGDLSLPQTFRLPTDL